MPQFETRALSDRYDAIAPDGSEVYILAKTDKASSIFIKLHPGQVSNPIKHSRIDELWYCTEGTGQMWRKQGDYEEVVTVLPGMSLSIPEETHFQFRNMGSTTLCFFLTTVPPWPGDDVVRHVQGIWQPAL